MRKMNFLKTVLGVAAATLITVSANGQVANSDYLLYDANRLVPTNIDYLTLRTSGSTVMGYYALPDPVFHPSYSAPGWTLTAGFTWNWTVVPAMATAKPGAANYVQITYTATGNYAVTVAETAPAAMGGCVDATPTVMNVTVIAPPVATITTVDPAQACGNQAAASVALQFTENIPATLAGYAFAVNQLIENIDVSDNLIGGALLDADTLDFVTTGKLETAGGLVGAASPYTWSFNTRPLRVLNGQRTRYTYTLIKASDAPGAALDGLVSAISEKSDYIAGVVSTYPFGAKSTFVAIINPAPATGPIYYIPNDFRY